MVFESISEFLAMGGHCYFVWSAYLITLIVLVINIIMPIISKKKFLKSEIKRKRREKDIESNT